MTGAQYRRLLIVLTGPLLIAGAIFTRTVIRPDNYATILCSNSDAYGENCRTTDGLGEKWDGQLRSEHPAWFDIQTRSYENNSLPFAIVSGSQRYYSGIRIVSVSGYAGTDESPGSPLDRLRAMTGREISIIFGNKERDTRLLNPLGCNGLNYDESRDTFTAVLCGIPNGLAQVEFKPEGQSFKDINDLKTKIDQEISEQRRNIFFDYAIGIPFFFLLFLFGSLLVWAVGKAINYIRAG